MRYPPQPRLVRKTLRRYGFGITGRFVIVVLFVNPFEMYTFTLDMMQRHVHFWLRVQDRDKWEALKKKMPICEIISKGIHLLYEKEFADETRNSHNTGEIRNECW